MILAIDTATEFAGLALLAADSLWAEEVWHAGRNHTVELSPRLHRMLKKAAVSLADLDGIAVCVGPGSYTGVRIGVAVAKGFALPHNLPTVGISSLDITAHPFRRQSLPVVAIVRAGRKRVITAEYGWDNGGWHQRTTPRITTVDELAATFTASVLVAGEFSAAEADVIRQNSGNLAQVVNSAERVRRPGVLAELGAASLAAGDSGRLSELIPIYMKNPGE